MHTKCVQQLAQSVLGKNVALVIIWKLIFCASRRLNLSVNCNSGSLGRERLKVWVLPALGISPWDLKAIRGVSVLG